MTEPIVQRNAANSGKLGAETAERRSLNYQETYICPVCRHGQISSLTLMDAFACGFCRHIFTANLQEQSIRVEDSSQPMTWRWNGRHWQSAHQLDADLTFVVWLVGASLVILPPGLIWLSSHTFPPLRGSALYWFPSFWIGLSFCLHFLFVAWLLAEHYQISLYVACRVRIQDWLGRR
ncbi:hypothetical protein K9N68_07530 [Kovacikia minuta CCNUW1]|uniref:hypothetical protein n=1 Tax=Kovacikia minuta TaxID=2931930 RepID=UPI001CCD8D31|nr:hypothetical protein [Kovacikia minuta]UBF27755.1 hypothetical protein K9N68_07530 [Kovacikia minuta CCNUW1]